MVWCVCFNIAHIAYAEDASDAEKERVGGCDPDWDIWRCDEPSLVSHGVQFSLAKSLKYKMAGSKNDHQICNGVGPLLMLRYGNVAVTERSIADQLRIYAMIIKDGRTSFEDHHDQFLRMHPYELWMGFFFMSIPYCLFLLGRPKPALASIDTVGLSSWDYDSSLKSAGSPANRASPGHPQSRKGRKGGKAGKAATDNASASDAATAAVATAATTGAASVKSGSEGAAGTGAGAVADGVVGENAVERLHRLSANFHGNTTTLKDAMEALMRCVEYLCTDISDDDDDDDGGDRFAAMTYSDDRAPGANVLEQMNDEEKKEEERYVNGASCTNG